MGRVLMAALLSCVLMACAAACGTAPAPLPPGADEPSAPLATASPPEDVPQEPGCDETPTKPAGLVPPPVPMPAPGQFTPGGSLSMIYGGGRLRVGVARDTQSRGAWNPVTARFEGFDIDIAARIAMALFGVGEQDVHRHLEFYPVSFSERWDALEDRDGDGDPDVDVVVSTNSYTCARAKKVRLSAAYFTAHKRFVSRRARGQAGTGIGTEADLAGKRVCVAPATTTEKALEGIGEKIPSMTLVKRWKERSDCLVAFQRGEVDVLAGNDASLVGVLAQDTTTVLGGLILPEPEYYTVASALGDDELAGFVNGVIDGLVSDLTAWFELCRRWDAPEMPCENAFPPTPAWRGDPPRER